MRGARYGWIRDLPDQRDLAFSSSAPLLPSVDLRSGCPTVYDQGQLGSCTANAIAGQLDFNRHKQGESFITPSRLFIYYNERLSMHTTGSDSGASIRSSVKEVVKYGACLETEWPYRISNYRTKPSPACYTEAVKYEALSYQRIARTVTMMQSCLSEGYPFVAGITVYQSFESPSVAKTGQVPLPSSQESVLGGHAIMVVGYQTDSKLGSQWICRNSWGSAWGDQGYFYLPQSYLLNSGLSSDFWTLRAVK